MREMLLDRAMDGRITGIFEETKRVPEAKGGLQRARIGVESARLGIGTPLAGP
jgi:hypothetical protein